MNTHSTASAIACRYNNVNINQSTSLFYHLLSKSLSGGAPNREIIRRATVKGIGDLAVHAEKYNIDITSLDTVKLIIFTSFYLLPELSEKFNITQQDVYKAIIGFILFSYEVNSIKQHPDADNTARILTQFYHPEQESDKNKMAVYTYFKGMQESLVAFHKNKIS
ncbi:hypothetical protein MNB_SUP05-SYMBIONT-5-63 [hydrothermal vent metagenome]|uniref:Uncharacterized protein n=1 Tax=hydrothermal vent metagenome TaxID=652676 RepID=A0A1W1E1T9_9ZZZZ